jgi:glycogen operon protein
VNFVTAHDGFTLNDVVSYNEKHNEANGEENRDGHSHNRTWNCGAEGPTKSQRIYALRERQKRNMLATLMFSQGTPMLLAGDEIGHTQRGNNNAYCQDNEISWINWSMPASARRLLAFTRKLIAIRHKYPILRYSRFLTSEVNPDTGVKPVTWISAGGAEMDSAEWGDDKVKCFGMILDGRAQPTGARKRGNAATLLLVMNAWQDVVVFTLPSAPEGSDWKLLVDTNVPEDGTGRTFAFGETYEVTARSLLLFEMTPLPAA